MTSHEWMKRVAFDAVALIIVAVIVLIVLFAYHGQEAYVALNQILAAQAQAQAQAQKR